jgi:hypothetical protein
MAVVGWSVFGFCSNSLKDMVGPWGLEPQTSTVSNLKPVRPDATPNKSK